MRSSALDATEVGEIFDAENEGVSERWALELSRVVEIAARLVAEESREKSYPRRELVMLDYSFLGFRTVKKEVG